MKCRENDSNFAQIVVSHTEAYLDDFNVRRDSFVTDRLLPSLEASAVITADDPQDADGYQKWKSRKCKQAERMMKGDTPLPAAFVLAWVAALPAKYAKRCAIDLAASLGTVYTPIETMAPASQPQTIRSRLDEISREFADVLQHSAPAMDGLYDSTDNAETLQLLADELYELQAATMNEMGRIYRARGILPRGHKMMLNSPLFQEA